MRYFFDNIKNNIDFFLRNRLAFSIKNYYEKNEDKQNIFITSEQKETFERLNNKYNLEILNNTTKRNFLENLYFLDVFDKYFSDEIKQNSAVCDIGSKNWYYVKSEYIFFQKFGIKRLDGIELDAGRLNSDFYSRKEIAKFHTKDLKNTNYIAEDFLFHNEKYDYIIWILPFISRYPHIKWGLPERYFAPEKMLSHAYELLNDGGEILIINQEENEYNIQKELNEKLKLNTEYFGEFDDVFSVFLHKRYCLKIKK